jgi:predicted RNase H-like HicB family nuclease
MSRTINIEYTVQIWKEGNQFISHAMPLDDMSSGQTPEEARKALDEAVNLFLATAADMGTLDEILEEAGYQLSGPIHKYGDVSRTSNRLTSKARGGRIPGVFNRRATLLGGMHWRPNASVFMNWTT